MGAQVRRRRPRGRHLGRRRGGRRPAWPLRRRDHRHGLRRRSVPVPDAPHHHRDVPRGRVRPAQRVLRAPPTPAAGVLPGPPDRRPDVARHERLVRGTDDGRPGHHVHGHHVDYVRRGAGPDAVDLAEPDPSGTAAAAGRLDRGEAVRGRDLRPFGENPGTVGPPERHRPGGVGGGPRRAGLSLRAGRDRPVPRGQSGIRRPESADGPGAGCLPPEPCSVPRPLGARGPLDRQPAGDRRAADGRRPGGVQRLRGDVELADDRVRLGDQHAAARPGGVAPHARCARGGAGRRRPAGRGLRPRPHRFDSHPRARRVSEPDLRLQRPQRADEYQRLRRAGAGAGAGRPDRVGEVDARRSAAAPVRAAAGNRPGRWRRCPRSAVAGPARRHRLCAAGALPLLDHGGGECRLRGGGRACRAAARGRGRRIRGAPGRGRPRRCGRAARR